jgi:hypothetical protein
MALPVTENVCSVLVTIFPRTEQTFPLTGSAILKTEQKRFVSGSVIPTTEQTFFEQLISRNSIEQFLRFELVYPY